MSGTDVNPLHHPHRPVVLWGGDVNLGRRQHYRAAEIGTENVLGRIAALRTADLRIANLECVVAASGEQGGKGSNKGPYYFRARPEMLRILTSAHIDMVATANNHSGDYGPEALLEQGHWLDRVGIAHAGSGANMEAGLQPALRRAGDLNVALFSLDATEPRYAATDSSPGIAHLAPDNPARWRETLAPRIAALRHQAHVILVAVHWGLNHAEKPDPETRDLARAVIDAGADAVLGSSAHLVQGAEIYRHRPILYDAGNLLFDSIRATLHHGGIFALEISPHGVEQIRFVPIGIGYGYTVQLSGREARKAVDRFTELCSDLGTVVLSEKDQTGTIALAPPPRPSAVNSQPAPFTRFDLSIFEGSIPSTTARGEAEQVPGYARIAPVRLGPLTLLGLHARPRTITHRRMIYVESFWTSDIQINEDIRLNIRGVPVHPTTMPVWGKSMDHDPCDWLAPTSRWKPGFIYRDFYGLRAPRKYKLANVDLRIEVGILSRNHPDIPPYPGPVLKMAIPELKTPSPSNPTPIYRTDFPASTRDCLPGQTWTASQLQEVTGGTWLVAPPNGWFIRSLAYQRSFISRLPAPFFFVAHTLEERMRHAQSTTAKEGYDRHADVHRLVHRLAGVMVSRPIPHLPTDFPVLLVPDPIKALIELGLAARQRFQGHVVGITGTTGKSTSISMLIQMLGGSDRVLASMNNYNMRIDVPALLANVNPQHEAVLVEIAQSALWMKRGPVTRLIQPTIAVITEIGMSQTDRMGGSVQDTAKWKARIFDGLVSPAVAVIGEHVPCFDYIHNQAAIHAQRVLVFGTSASADIRIMSVRPDEWGSRIELQTPNEHLVFSVPVPGKGMVHNAVAAVSVLHAMGRDLLQATQALAGYRPNRGCMQQHDMILRKKAVRLIDDSWNATVSSMRNAFAVLGQMHNRGPGRKIALLGRMVHLGDLAQTLHEELAAPLLATGVDLVITHGDEMHWLRARLPEQILGPHWDDASSAAGWIYEHCHDGDLILVKGSRRDSDFGDIVGILATYETAESTEALPNREEPVPAASFPLPDSDDQNQRIRSISEQPNDYSHSPYVGMGTDLTETLLHNAASRRNLMIITHPGGYFEIIQNGRGTVFRRNSPDHSILAAIVTADKLRAKKLLAQEGIPTLEGAVFVNLKAAEKFYTHMQANQDRPVCIKPAVSTQGQGVTPTVSSLETLPSAWKLARRFSRRIALEVSAEGRNVRVMVLGGRAVGAFECLPVAVTGNGRDSIHELIQAHNQCRSANPWLNQWPATRFDALKHADLSLGAVPDPETVVPLSHVASIGNGSDTIALADSVHASLLELAEHAAHCFPGLHLACVSLICDDPARPVAEQAVAVLDIDAKPAIADLAFPAFGPALDLSNALLDYALDLARRRPIPDHPPCIRPASLFTPPAEAVFALDTRLENQLLRHAARSRHLKAERLSTKMTRISGQNHQILFYKTMSPGTRVVARQATNGSKEWTKQLLRASGLPTPAWRTFNPDQQTEAWQYLQSLDAPAVIKPLSGSWGRGVTANVTNLEHFTQAWKMATLTQSKNILVEEYAHGRLYRLFIVGNALVAAAEILPSQITGNGTQAIRDLIAAQNLLREQDPCLAQCPIVLTPSVRRHLHEQGLDEDSVLEAGRQLQLDIVANIGVGGTSRDVTDQVHPDFAPIAAKTRMAVFDPPHVGIDLIAPDIAAPPNSQPWTIIEVNTNPALDMHHFPASGHPRDVAGSLIEFFFQTSAPILRG